MNYKAIRIVLWLLALCPAWFVSECLHRYAPGSWAPAWGKAQCLEVLEDVLFSRY